LNDEAGSARMSFYPPRKGSYEMLVRDHSEPPQSAIATIIVE